jgi:hypothetical protein
MSTKYTDVAKLVYFVYKKPGQSVPMLCEQMKLSSTALTKRVASLVRKSGGLLTQRKMKDGSIRYYPTEVLLAARARNWIMKAKKGEKFRNFEESEIAKKLSKEITFKNGSTIKFTDGHSINYDGLLERIEPPFKISEPIQVRSTLITPDKVEEEYWRSALYVCQAGSIHRVLFTDGTYNEILDIKDIRKYEW